MRFWLAILIFCFAGLSAFADPRFGAEFELSNLTVAVSGGQRVQSPAAARRQRKLTENIMRRCPKCTVELGRNHYGSDVYKVSFPDRDFWIQVSTDPGTVEIQTRPSTSKEFAANKDALDMMFAAGRDAGLSPNAVAGQAGHIHIDIASAFQGDARLFRNFIVDFMNNPGLGGGGPLGADNYNAPHISELKESQKLALREVISEFDQGKITGIKELSMAIDRRVYDETLSNWNPPNKYQALNLTRAELPDGQSTIELRGIGAQRSPDEFFAHIRLFERRIEFLKSIDIDLPLGDLKKVSTRRMTAQLRAYVEESGLSWPEYKKLLRGGNIAGFAVAAESTIERKPSITRNSWWKSCSMGFGSL